MDSDSYEKSSDSLHIPTLDIIHDRFVRMFRITLSAALRRPVDITVRSSKSVKFNEYLKHLTVPSSLNLFRMTPLKGTAIFMMEPRMVFNLLNIFYGGTGELEIRAEGRDFTAIEQRLVKRVVISVLEDLQTAWKPYYKVALSYARTEINPLFVAIVPQNSPVLVTTFDVDMGEKPMTMSFCIPHEMIKPLMFLFKVKKAFSSPFVKNLTNLLELGYKTTPLPPVVQKMRDRIKESLNSSDSAPSCVDSKEMQHQHLKQASGDESLPLAGLQQLEPKVIAGFILNEHPQTITLILAHLVDPKKTAKVIETLPQKLRADITYRMAILKSIPPGVITEIEAVLNKELQRLEANPIKDVGGIKTVAGILDAMDKKAGDDIIKTIKASNPNLADSLAKSMDKKNKKSTKKTPAKKTTRKLKS